MPRYQKSQAFAKANIGQLITTSSKQTVESLTASTTLEASDSGKIFTLDNATGFVVTLPSPGAAGAGWSATFILGLALVGSSHTIVGGSGTLNGTITAGTSPGSTDVGANTITFDHTASVAVGDSVTIVSNGTAFYVSGHSGATVGVTITTV